MHFIHITPLFAVVECAFANTLIISQCYECLKQLQNLWIKFVRASQSINSTSSELVSKITSVYDSDTVHDCWVLTSYKSQDGHCSEMKADPLRGALGFTAAHFMKQVSVKFYRDPPLIISLTGNRYVIKTFIIKLLLRLLNTRALSSFKDINRLSWREGENSSPPQFPHYSQRPVNGFVIMACLPRILSNCPPSRSKSLLYIRWPLSVLFSLLITHDEGPLHQIAARVGRFKTTWGSAARHPVLLISRPQESEVFFQPKHERLKSPAYITPGFTRFSNLSPPAAQSSSNQSSSHCRADNKPTRWPVCAHRAWAVGVIWRWEVAKQRPGERKKER